MQSILNVFLLLMLIFFMFATLGVFFFSDISDGSVINAEYKNFKRFGDGFLLLFAISTGEAWNEIMYDCYLAPDDCTPGVDCGTPFAPAYFITFIMLVTHVMLNLFILVIIEQFERFYLNVDSPLVQFSRAGDGTLEVFQRKWAALATVTTKPEYLCRVIRERDLLELYADLPYPMGPPAGTKEDEMKKKILQMGVGTENGFIHFNELLYRLARAEYGGKGGEVFRLPPSMQVIEVRTQYKLAELARRQCAKIFEHQDDAPGAKAAEEIDGPPMKQSTLRLSLFGGKKSKSQRKEEVGAAFLRSKDRQTRTAKSVNPFLTNMFFKISFSSWRNLVARYRKENGLSGPPPNDDSRTYDLPPFDKQAAGTKVEFNYYEEQAYSTEEEEPEEDVPPSRSASQHPTEKRARRSRRQTTFGGVPLSPTSGGKTEDLMADSVASSRAAKSPEMHRKTAKRLALDAQRRLSSLDANAFPSRLSLLRVSSPGKKSPTARNVNAHHVSLSDS